jgi:hypothetical protein
MTAKRTPKKRPPRRPITPAAIAIFRRIQALECTCSPTGERCSGCEEYWQLHHRLHLELKFKPWDRGVVPPEEDCPDYADPHASVIYMPTVGFLIRSGILGARDRVRGS